MKTSSRTKIAAIGLVSSFFVALSAQAATLNYEIDYPTFSTESSYSRAQVVEELNQQAAISNDQNGEFLSYPGKTSTASDLSRAEVKAQQQEWAATHNTYVAS